MPHCTFLSKFGRYLYNGNLTLAFSIEYIYCQIANKTLFQLEVMYFNTPVATRT